KKDHGKFAPLGLVDRHHFHRIAPVRWFARRLVVADVLHQLGKLQETTKGWPRIIGLILLGRGEQPLHRRLMPPPTGGIAAERMPQTGKVEKFVDDPSDVRRRCYVRLALKALIKTMESGDLLEAVRGDAVVG